jgi:Thrombospondin type 3 repeat
MTGYRGRVYSTFDGNVDDNAYWEFGGARDDAQLFTGTGGLTVQMNGPEPVPNSGGKLRTVLRVLDTPGPGGSIAFNPQRGPLIRIDGDQSGPVPTNVLTLRMRLPSDPDLLAALRANPREGDGYFATVRLEGGPRPVSLRIPRNENAYLVPDGNFRNYSVLLNDVEEFRAGGRWTSFTLTPSNRPVKGLEIDYVRFSHETAAKDADKVCAGTGGNGSDGWPDAEDNCPEVWNPSQNDGNGDGVGDACEDYDGDKVANACDNCPLLTNSSQRDRNKDNKGDACDPESTEGCFTDGTVAGPLRRPSAIGLLAVTALGLAMVWRRRRR